MRDLLTEARSRLRHEPVERRVRATIGSDDGRRHHAAGARLGAAPGRPVLRRPRRGHPGRTPPRPRPTASAGRAAPRNPVQRPHGRRPAGHDRRPHRRRIPARRRGPGGLRGARLRRVRRVVRGGRADLRPPARTVPPRRRPARAHARSGSRSTARSWPRRRRAAGVRDGPAIRFYLPREDIRAAARPSDAARLLPVQGRGVLLVARRRRARPRGPGWSYEQPLPDAAELTGLVAFWDERVDVFLDGERRNRHAARSPTRCATSSACRAR